MSWREKYDGIRLWLIILSGMFILHGIVDYSRHNDKQIRDLNAENIKLNNTFKDFIAHDYYNRMINEFSIHQMRFLQHKHDGIYGEITDILK